MIRLVRGTAVLALAMAGPAMGQAMGQAVVSTGVGTPFELAFWQSIDSSNDPSLYEAYLNRFPGGTFSEIAHAKIVTLRGRLAAQAAPAAITPAVAVAPVVVPPPPPPPAPVVTPPEPLPPVTAPVATPAAVPAEANGTLGQLLAALANSQSTAGAHDAAVARPTSAGFALPPRPAMKSVPPVPLPPNFCSAEQRNAFHAQVYVPSVDVARRNNEAAADYMRQLQALYDSYQLSHDPDTMNAIVDASRAYQPVAHDAFAAQAALVREFGALMAVPVTACAQGTPLTTTAAK